MRWNGTEWVEDEQLPQSNLLTGPETAQPASALVAPDPYQAPYAEDRMRDPRRQLWGGMLMDLGNLFGSWNGSQFTRPMTGMGFRMQNKAQTANERMQAANLRAKQQWQQAQNQYAQMAYGRDKDATAQQFEQEQFAYKQQQDALKMQIERAKMAQQSSGLDLKDTLSNANTFRDDFRQDTKQASVVLEMVERAEGAASVYYDPNSTKQQRKESDISLLYAVMKARDPGSIVTESDFNAASKPAGITDQAWNIVRQAQGQGLSNEQRRALLQEIKRTGDQAIVGYDRQVSRYEAMAEGAGIPSQYVVDPRTYNYSDDFLQYLSPQAQAQAQAGTPAPSAELPPMPEDIMEALEEDRTYQTRARSRR